ncbi:MAG TPA: hypothetical protein VN222_08915 [Novosphingobium sp.]|nr:hypothetical protein [Novosphingobium sp.]
MPAQPSLPSPAPPRARLLLREAAVLVLMLGFGLVLRVHLWGSISSFPDDSFYFLVGQKMHEGFLPYVDIWDRKPLGLFLIYYAIAGVSRSVYAYQIAGWLAATATGWVLYRMMRPLAGTQGAICAGLAYLAVTCAFGGEQGQAPIFYNGLVAGAFRIIIGNRGRMQNGQRHWSIWLAMLLLGLAITIKQTVAFEAAFAGCYVVASLWRGGMPARRLVLWALGMIGLGILPSLAIAAYYGLVGHWSEYWHAMVLANLRKQPQDLTTTLRNGVVILMHGAPLLAVAAWGLARQSADPGLRRFMALWLCAAMAGFLSVPYFTLHYALPLLVPLCAIAGLAFASAQWGRIAFVALLCLEWLWIDPLAFADARQSAQAMDRLATMIRAHDNGGGLLVYDGPSYLYALTGEKPLSPLVFPQHLSYPGERNVSHLDTLAEVRRMISARPGVVVMRRQRAAGAFDAQTAAMVDRYVHDHCRLSGVARPVEFGTPTDIAVYGDCRPAPS